MTEPVPTASSGSAARTARRRPRFWPTAVASLACFAVIFEFLAFQLRAGNDPALGAGPAAAAAPTRPVVNRRIVQRRIVHLPARQTAIPAAPTVGGSSATTTPSSPPATAPASVPVPAPAPAPALPAPVTSSS